MKNLIKNILRDSLLTEAKGSSSVSLAAFRVNERVLPPVGTVVDILSAVVILAKSKLRVGIPMNP